MGVYSRATYGGYPGLDPLLVEWLLGVGELEDNCCGYANYSVCLTAIPPPFFFLCRPFLCPISLLNPCSIPLSFPLLSLLLPPHSPSLLFPTPPSLLPSLPPADASSLNYQVGLGRYTQMVSSGSFSEISSFMPGIKTLLQMAMQLQV